MEQNHICNATVLVMIFLFTGCSDHEVPVVITSDISEITISSARSGGTIITNSDSEILAKGVCWSTAQERWSIPQEPTTESLKTTDGAGSGTFSSYITGLNPGSTYYIRAYATNKHGTGYGPEKIFKTPGDLPSATTGKASDVTAFSARLEGRTDPQCLTGKVYFEYGTTSEYGQSINAGQVTGDVPLNITAFLTDLSPDTKYHFRIRAENVLGVVFGEDQTFKTSEIITDIDGFVYEVVTIGKQKWMKENLRTTRYRDGSVIPLVSSDSQWSLAVSGAYSSYSNDNSIVSSYGALYNWFAVTDPRGLCPAGWHVPGNEEWSSLINILGGLESAGGKMKRRGTEYWLSPNKGAVNSSGFTAFGAGYRDMTGMFSGLKKVEYFWSSTEYSSTHGISRKIYHDKRSISFSGNYKQSGFSVRCIKD